jgi:hypothetical protein
VAGCFPEVIGGSCFGLSDQGLELGEHLLDGIEIGAVGRQKIQMGSCSFDRSSGFLAFVARQIIKNHDVAWLQKRDELGLDPGIEAGAVDGAVKNPRRVDAIQAEPSHEGERLPASMRDFRLKRGAALAPAAHARHVRLDPCLIHKDKPPWVNFVLMRLPAGAKARRLGPHLFLCE